MCHLTRPERGDRRNGTREATEADGGHHPDGGARGHHAQRARRIHHDLHLSAFCVWQGVLHLCWANPALHSASESIYRSFVVIYRNLPMLGKHFDVYLAVIVFSENFLRIIFRIERVH